jgi:hypothetical protein
MLSLTVQFVCDNRGLQCAQFSKLSSDLADLRLKTNLRSDKPVKAIF